MRQQDFGKRLIEVRKAKGLTQEEAAEKCRINVRTIQRIESGLVKPRAFTIKIISETLGFDFFETSETGYDVNNENQTSKLESHSLLWHLKDLFNLKTYTMRKISILSTSVLIILILCIDILNTNAQTDNTKKQKSLIIEYNKDKSIKRVEAAFTRQLNLDSLVQIKKDLQAIGIIINYYKLEFDVHNLLVDIDCGVICNDGFSGSFGAGPLNKQPRDMRYGFYRDYSPDAKSPFGTGLLNDDIAKDCR